MSPDVTLTAAAPATVAPAAPGVGFARDLRRHGDRLAVVTPDGGRLTYHQLADRVAEAAAALGHTRKLVLIAASNDVEPLVAYLAALAGGHPVLLAAADDCEHLESLAAAYNPDVIGRANGGRWGLDVRRTESAHELHPELALLLSTSGSTGSRKLVRLSTVNVQSNAAAIADYLDIRPTDRAVTSLPMQYCYGLSVINSNLLRGAGLLLTDASVIEERFWSTMREYGGTSLHGVPYTFELLDRAGFADRELPSLRYVTQAGGRLDPQRVRAFAELGEQRGWRLFVMYGQTEATARMAYLPPEQAVRRPDAIGVPIPGGSFELAGAPGCAEGELLYRGPNVMLGYATTAADLALGRTVEVLATGDIGRRGPDGLYQVLGRTGRFLKVCGLRVELDQLERLLADAGVTAACTGDDDAVAVGIAAGHDPGAVRRLVAGRLGLPADRVLVAAFDRLPRLDCGKLDYPRVRAMARQQVLPTAASGVVNRYQRLRARRPMSVREIYAKVLHRSGADIDDDDTFVGLGGDSLHYVSASLELERALGVLPPDWPTTPVCELERPAARRRVLAAVETNIVLRAVAITLVVGTHLGLFRVFGGAHLLLVLAGWSFARFCLDTPAAGRTPSGRILRSATRIAIPGMLWIAWRATSQADTGVASALLVSGYLAPQLTIAYWFIEVLVHILLGLGLLFAVPAVRRLDQRHPLAVPLLVLAVGYAIRLLSLQPPGKVEWWLTHQVLWLFALGWLAQRTATRGQQLLVLVAAGLMVPAYFTDPLRCGIVLGGLALVLLVPQLRLPRVLVRPIGAVAGASLYIYLTHYALIPGILRYLDPLWATAFALLLGVAAWLALEYGIRGARWVWSRVGRLPMTSSNMG